VARKGGRRWRELQAQVVASSDVCWLCGQLVWRNVKATHPMAPSADHVLPVDTHPELEFEWSNLRVAHYGCNSARGNRAPWKPPETSRRW